jgi:hypothetical protein
MVMMSSKSDYNSMLLLIQTYLFPFDGPIFMSLGMIGCILRKQNLLISSILSLHHLYRACARYTVFLIFNFGSIDN